MYTLTFNDHDIVMALTALFFFVTFFTRKGRYRFRKFLRQIISTKYPFLTAGVYCTVLLMCFLLSSAFVNQSPLMTNPYFALGARFVCFISIGGLLCMTLMPLWLYYEDRSYKKELEFNKMAFNNTIDVLAQSRTEAEIVEELNQRYYNTALYEDFAKNVIRSRVHSHLNLEK